MRAMSRLAMMFAAVLALAACSKSEPARTPAAAPAAPAPAAPPAAPVAAPAPAAEPAQPPPAPAAAADLGEDFDKLSHDDKVKVMKTKVVPQMKAAFQAFDPQHYAKFNCESCHGPHAKDKHFKMPNPDLPKLDFAALQAGKQKPEIAKFMAETVKPQMAKLLGHPEMTKDNPNGFGCLGCHVQK
jgi:hypothetical protein